MSKSSSDLQKSMWARIQDAKSLQDILGIIDEIAHETSKSTLSAEAGAELVTLSFRAASALTHNTSEAAKSIIVDKLLPLCVNPTTRDNSDAKYESYNLRKLLAAWIYQYPQSQMEPLRNQVVAALGDLLASMPEKEVLWTIAAIGYREDDVIDSVWALALSRDDNVGDAAFSTIASLGLTPDSEDRFRALLRHKAQADVTRVTYALQETAGCDELDVLLALMPPAGSDDAKPLAIPFLSLVNTLTRIAGSIPENSLVQDRVWSKLREYRREVSASRENAGRCNTEETVVDYARWIVETGTAHDKDASRYIDYDRMSTLLRPRQLLGWSLVDREAIMPVIQHDACIDSKIAGQFVTTSARLKEAAWETAFCLGLSQCTDWIESAIRDETNPYVKHALLDIISCLRLDELPKYFLDLIHDEFNVGPDDPPDELFTRIGVIRLAHSCASRPVFDALLNCGFTQRGEVLLSTADALTEVALTRINSGETDILDRLLTVAEQGEIDRHRDIAIYAITVLARRGLVDGTVVDSLMKWSQDPSLDQYSQCKALEAVGFLPRNASVGVAGLLTHQSSELGEIGWRALEALARHELLAEDSHLLTYRIGLEEGEQSWQFRDSETINGWQAFLVGLLYEKNPTQFACAVRDVFERADRQDIFQIYSSAAHHGSETDQRIVNSVVQRARRTCTRTSAETELLALFARIAPERLVNEHSRLQWTTWLLEGRVALCEAVGQALHDNPPLRPNGLVALTQFTHDRAFAVRRSAYRALSKIDPASLLSVCLGWMNAKDIERRKRAAEAVAWVPQELFSDEELLDWDLTTDRERSVRELAKQALGARQERAWAARYLTEVLKVDGLGNEELLAKYRYGRALTKLGDDEDRRQILRRLREADLPTHLAHWLNQLATQIGKRWREVTNQWPEPWSSETGTIERAKGALVAADGTTLPGKFLLWCRNKTGPSDLGEWGGVLEPSDNTYVGPFFNATFVEIRVPGRRSANVVVTKHYKPKGTKQDRVMISGSGNYPSKGVENPDSQ